jgi:hypothetical protein
MFFQSLAVGERLLTNITKFWFCPIWNVCDIIFLQVDNRVILQLHILVESFVADVTLVKPDG